MKMEKTYNPKEFEEKLYKFWNDSGFFTAKVDKNKEPFTIVIPPPNVTGQLHMGHALNNAIQDTIVRFKRMQGYSTLWLPGVDHASIATEVKVVEKMKKEEGLSKNDVGRDGFMKSLGVEKSVWRTHSRTAEEVGLVARLEPRSVHYGRKM